MSAVVFVAYSILSHFDTEENIFMILY